jgi:hypothetical protein
MHCSFKLEQLCSMIMKIEISNILEYVKWLCFRASLCLCGVLCFKFLELLIYCGKAS